MAEKDKAPHYIKLLDDILGLSNLRLCEKMLLAYIHGYGRKGCFQGNEELAVKFKVCPRTISFWIKKLKTENLVLWINDKTYYRTLWSRFHPEVRCAETLIYRNEEISKNDVISGHRLSTPLRKIRGGRKNSTAQKCQSYRAMGCAVTAQKLRPYIITDKINNKPQPAPAETQAEADNPKPARWIPLTEAQQTERKKEMLKQLQSA